LDKNIQKEIPSTRKAHERIQSPRGTAAESHEAQLLEPPHQLAALLAPPSPAALG
jgi:hypothetical protein